MVIAGYSAYPRTLDFSQFRDIADSVNATLLVDMAHFAGLVAAGLHTSPIPYADFVTSTTHKTLRGPRGGLILCTEAHKKTINSKIFPGTQGGPLEHVIAGKAVAFGEALKPEFKTYMSQVLTNAKVLAEALMNAGFSLVTNGTENHLVLMDLTDRGNISGKDAENALTLSGITVNKNTVPKETRSPFVTSGIRLGTPALTTRGMGSEEMKTIAGWISQVLNDHTNTSLLETIRSEVKALCDRFPIYTNF